MFNPVLVNTNDNIKVAITESDLDDYPGMFLKGNSSNSLTADFAPYPSEEKMVDGDYPEMIVTKRADYIAKTNGTRNFPWRVLLIAREDKDLPANDLFIVSQHQQKLQMLLGFILVNARMNGSLILIFLMFLFVQV